MYAMQVDQDINCRSVGRCVFGAHIDRELADMIPMDENGAPLDMTTDASKQFIYVRYNADLSERGLAQLGVTGIDTEDVRKMDSVEHLSQLREVGSAVGKQQVRVRQHFSMFVN